MKVLLLKALFCALLSTVLFFNTNSAFGAQPVINKAEEILHIVNLNKSTIEDLVTLKGIGHKKAQAILAYREKMGDFKSLDDLINVKGIGEKILKDNMGRLKI
jgi:competence protein ComEA